MFYVEPSPGLGEPAEMFYVEQSASTTVPGRCREPSGTEA
jgi:hypothetical protein